jgi:hypothetical protein
MENAMYAESFTRTSAQDAAVPRKLKVHIRYRPQKTLKRRKIFEDLQMFCKRV